MRKGDSSRLETLEALIAEKRKHEGYLAKLEERRAGTPEHVFVRLRDEYLTKLTDAQVRAAAEAELVSGGLEEDEAAVAEIESRLAALTEERVEGELRAAVGEYDPKEWQKKLTALTAGISMAEKERDARVAVYEQARALLAEARGTALPPRRETPGSASTGGSEPAATPASPAASKTRPTTMSAGPNFDELAFLKSVVGRPSTPETPALRSSKPVDASTIPPERPPRATPAPSTGGTRKTPAPITEGPSVKPPASSGGEGPSAKPPAARREETRAAEPAPPAPRPTAGLPLLEDPTETVPAPAPTPEEPPAASEASSAPVPAPDLDAEPPSNPLGAPTPRTSQAIKTLKCAECGSMNYPTEWYCERCGGELAAL